MPTPHSDLRVLVDGPNPASRAVLASLLGAHPACVVVGERERGADAGEAELGVSDAVLWDLGEDPRKVLESLAAATQAGIPIVALAANGADARGAMAAGAHGVLSRTADATRLVAAAHAASCGLVVLDPTLGVRLGGRREAAELPAEPLTPREHEVLHLLAEGLSNRDIGGRLGISAHTVKYHVTAILGKLGAETRAEAVARAARDGMLFM